MKSPDPVADLSPVISHLACSSQVNTYVSEYNKATSGARAQQPGLLQAALISPSLETQKECQLGHHGYGPTGNQDPPPAQHLLLTSLLP